MASDVRKLSGSHGGTGRVAKEQRRADHWETEPIRERAVRAGNRTPWGGRKRGAIRVRKAVAEALH